MGRSDIFDILEFFNKFSKKDDPHGIVGIDHHFASSLKCHGELHYIIQYLIDNIHGYEGKSKSSIKLIFNLFILHEELTNKQVYNIVKNNYLYYNSLFLLKKSKRFGKMPEYLKKIILNKIKELER